MASVQLTARRPQSSQPYQDRRVCAGNTNCIPICPITGEQYDPSVTLAEALRSGNVQVPVSVRGVRDGGR